MTALDLILLAACLLALVTAAALWLRRALAALDDVATAGDFDGDYR
jgi:hypothetical protein